MPGLIFLYTEYFAQHNSKEDTDATKNGKEKRERKKNNLKRGIILQSWVMSIRITRCPADDFSLQDFTFPLRPEQSLSCLLGRTQTDCSSRKNTETSKFSNSASKTT